MAAPFRSAMTAVIVRYILEFVEAAREAGLGIRDDGIDLTRDKIQQLARRSSCKYAFYAPFFLAKGPRGLGRALIPLVLREAVFVVWSLIAAVQWMPAETAGESLRNALASLGSLIGFVVMAPNWSSLR